MSEYMNTWETDTDLLPKKLWGRPGTVWCLPSYPRLNKRFHWGVALYGLSRSRGWPVQRHSAIAWPLWELGENGNSLGAPASPCLLVFDDLSFWSLSGYRPKRGHESVMASEHRTSEVVVSSITHGPPLRRIDECISPRVLALNLLAREIPLWLIRNTLTIGRQAPWRMHHESHYTV